MIKFNNLTKELPYSIFKDKYEEARKKNQINIEAISISSYSKVLNEVNSRFVNLKILNNKDFIFFSNYNSPKSQEFQEHNQVTALIFWNTINIQIRLKGFIKKTSREYNKDYFLSRSKQKNALAISSDQSKLIDSYDSVVNKYHKALLSDNLNQCPENWGGYSFTPYYFEFWEGHESRLNKRNVYLKNGVDWNHSILQP
tara:strand:- start:306 stop:902 length:597 start_codon:yes stop_codon:yes gene_type:complete